MARDKDIPGYYRLLRFFVRSVPLFRSLMLTPMEKDMLREGHDKYEMHLYQERKERETEHQVERLV